MLRMADFEHIDEEETPEKMENFLTGFQIKKKLKIPLSSAIIGQAIDFCGLRGFYKGHRIPNNPDDCAFTIRYNLDDEPYLTPLFHQRTFNEIQDTINDNEQFQQFLEEILKKEKKEFFNNDNFWVCDITATAPTSAIGKMLAFCFIKIENGYINHQKTHYYWVNPELSSKEIFAYTTPFKEGVRSNFDKIDIRVPGMGGANKDLFISKYQALKIIYKISKNNNIITAESDEVQDFMDSYFKDLNIESQHHFSNIIKNNISVINIGKIITGEFKTPFELAQNLNIRQMKSDNCLDRCRLISNITIELKKIKA